MIETFTAPAVDAMNNQAARSYPSAGEEPECGGEVDPKQNQLSYRIGWCVSAGS